MKSKPVLIKAEKGTARIQLLVARGPLDAKRVQWQKARHWRSCSGVHLRGGLRQNTPHVPVGFTKDDLLTELVKGGYVTVYLPEAAVKGLEVVTDQQTTQRALCIARVPAHR
jgi:hypothetical protein